jgi:glutamine synthetase
MTAKFAIRTIAKRHGLHATFMPKPKTGVHGSGLHLSFSLFQEGKDVFADKSDEYGLSKEAYYFMGGLMKHISGIAAITNPLVNSYKRLTPGYGAPIYVAWSAKNRSPLIRIPLTGDGIMAIELRCPDSAANPYLALAVCMAAGLDGIKQKIVPPSPVDRNISDLTEEERNAMQITLLPGSLGEAVAELKKDDFLCQVLGQEFVDGYINAKEEEWHEYLRQVSDWETEKYLYRI